MDSKYESMSIACKHAVEYIYNSLPVPHGCSVDAEAGHVDYFEKLIVVRRQFRFNVKDRVLSELGDHSSLKDLTKDSPILRRFGDGIHKELWNNISVFFDPDWRKSGISCDSKEDLNVYFYKGYNAVFKWGLFENKWGDQELIVNRFLWNVGFLLNFDEDSLRPSKPTGHKSHPTDQP